MARSSASKQDGSERHALVVRVVGVRSNRNGIGARVTIAARAGPQIREMKSGSSYLGQNDLRVHFGLGEATRVDRLDVRWPDGHVETIRDVPVGPDRDRHRRTGITGAYCLQAPSR